MKGPDGTIGPVEGEFIEVTAPTRLVYKTHKMGRDGKPEVTVVHTITLSREGRNTRFEMHSKVVMMTDSGIIPVSGMAVGTNQSLDKMETYLYTQQ